MRCGLVRALPAPLVRHRHGREGCAGRARRGQGRGCATKLVLPRRLGWPA